MVKNVRTRKSRNLSSKLSSFLCVRTRFGFLIVLYLLFTKCTKVFADLVHWTFSMRGTYRHSTAKRSDSRPNPENHQSAAHLMNYCTNFNVFQFRALLRSWKDGSILNFFARLIFSIINLQNWPWLRISFDYLLWSGWQGVTVNRSPKIAFAW